MTAQSIYNIVATRAAHGNVEIVEKAINRHCNAAVKEGYTKALDIFENRITDITKSSIGDLKTVQGRAIAACAIDYLQGWCSAETLCGVPIKKM